MITIETIRERSSVRSYSGEDLSEAERDSLNAIIGRHSSGLFGNKLRFMLVESPKSAPGNGYRVGTYGMVSGARAFIVGSVTKGERAFEDFGYALEGIVLEATAMGLGTCWLGGSFSRSDVAHALAVGPDELAPAVTPVGRPAKARTLRDRLVRRAIGAAERMAAAELFFDSGFEKPLEVEGPWAEVLEAVRFGPSASNKQPWRLVRTGSATAPVFHLFLHEDAAYNNALGDIHIQDVDMGIAMFNFEAAARAVGLPGSWKLGAGLEAPAPERYIASWSS